MPGFAGGGSNRNLGNAQIYTVFLRVGLPSGWLVRLDGSEGSNGSDVSDGSAGSDGSDELDSHLETPANGQAVVFLTGLFNNCGFFLNYHFGNSVGQLCPISSYQCGQKKD